MLSKCMSHSWECHIVDCGAVLNWWWSLWKDHHHIRKKKKSSSIDSDLKFQSLVLGRYLIWGYDTHGVFRKVSEVFLEKKIFEVGQLLLVLGTPQVRPFFFKIWEKSLKSPYLRNEVAQLQKNFFFRRAY